MATADDGDDEIEPGRDDQPAEGIAAELVGAGPVRRARRLQRLRYIRGDRIVRHDRRPENGDQHQEDDAGRGDRGQRIAAQDPGGMSQRRAGHQIDTLGSAIP